MNLNFCSFCCYGSNRFELKDCISNNKLILTPAFFVTCHELAFPAQRIEAYWLKCPLFLSNNATSRTRFKTRFNHRFRTSHRSRNVVWESWVISAATRQHIKVNTECADCQVDTICFTLQYVTTYGSHVALSIRHNDWSAERYVDAFLSKTFICLKILIWFWMCTHCTAVYQYNIFNRTMDIIITVSVIDVFLFYSDAFRYGHEARHDGIFRAM